MYWNMAQNRGTGWHGDWLIETWDVLKWCIATTGKAVNGINRNMRCIEINVTSYDYNASLGINRNMRCIEIGVCGVPFLCRNRLIETWDVLKSVIPEIPNHPEMINRNMRCIEMSGGAVQSESAGGINRNMRCIEMKKDAVDIMGDWRLIETWDVLKSSLAVWSPALPPGLIETWDVLKWRFRWRVWFWVND